MSDTHFHVVSLVQDRILASTASTDDAWRELYGAEREAQRAGRADKFLIVGQATGTEHAWSVVTGPRILRWWKF